MVSKNSPAIFIEKLWSILEANDKGSISWESDGLSFSIVDQESFISEVLSVNFNQSNYSSFIRQLNMYNFRKNRRNKEHQEFYHELFRKGHSELLPGIKRKPTQADILVGRELLKTYGLDSPFCDGQKTESTEFSKNREDQEIRQAEVVQVLSPKLFYPFPSKNQKFLVWNQREKSGEFFLSSGKENEDSKQGQENIYRNPICYSGHPMGGAFSYVLNNLPQGYPLFSIENYPQPVMMPISLFNPLNLLQSQMMFGAPTLLPITSEF